jgi:hypothetical protein
MLLSLRNRTFTLAYGVMLTLGMAGRAAAQYNAAARVVAVPRINNLRVVNTLESSTPAAATT